MAIKRGLVLSGGGSWGACGAGTLAALNREYDLVAGVSTGSLMAPLVALGEWERLRAAYTGVTQADIFNVNPFRANGKINLWKALYRLARGHLTLGESAALRTTIDRFITDNDFVNLAHRQREVVVACQETRYKPERVHYFSSRTETPLDFKDWMWASANAPVVMSRLSKPYTPGPSPGGTPLVRPGEWCDAGLTEILSLQEIIRRGATEIDVILHRYPEPNQDKGPVGDFFHNVVRLFSIMRREVEDGDLANGLAHAQINRCQVNVYRLPARLSENSLLFEEEKMNEWWELGYRTAYFESRITRYDFRPLASESEAIVPI